MTIQYPKGMVGYLASTQELFTQQYPDFSTGALTVDYLDGPRQGQHVIVEYVGNITSFDLGQIVEGKPPLPRN
jgi:hypothetical protein